MSLSTTEFDVEAGDQGVYVWATEFVPAWVNFFCSDLVGKESEDGKYDSRIRDGVFYPAAYKFSDAAEFQRQLRLAGESELPQFDRDQTRYQRRAAVKDELIAWMAADNMSRVRSGVWSVAELQALLVDLLAPVNGMMQTLSYEQAAQAIATAGNPLMTAEIKAAWVGKLTEHFYLGA